jgi:uroporphyrinogen-III decarboxylase
MIDNGLIPVLFTEGPYTQRLKYLTELPEGKCLIHFEEVDFKEAKRLLGGKNCMMGGFPNQLLMFGTPEQVSDKAKEVMDIMCPGGGYMFGTAASVDQAPRANMEALFRTIEDYGKY